MTIREALVREAHERYQAGGGCYHHVGRTLMAALHEDLRDSYECEALVTTFLASPILSALVDWADTSLEWMAAPDRDIADGLWRRQADTWQMLVELVREQTP